MTLPRFVLRPRREAEDERGHQGKDGGGAEGLLGEDGEVGQSPGRERGFCVCSVSWLDFSGVASLVRRDTLLWSSFARPLITAPVGTFLPLII
jgi:hypothetical protein